MTRRDNNFPEEYNRLTQQAREQIEQQQYREAVRIQVSRHLFYYRSSKRMMIF